VKSENTTKCYAVSLGGCNGISLEHIFTKGIFGHGMVETCGLPIPDGKRVGLSAAGANILCRHHNSLLNVLDDEIVRLANAVAEFRTSCANLSVQIQGPLIERWFLKFIVGIASASWLGDRLAPTDGVVRQLFGIEPLDPNFALFGLSGLKRNETWNRSVAVYFFRQGSREVDMALCVINELPLLFCPGVASPQEAFRSVGSAAGYDVTQVRVVRRPPALSMRLEGSESALGIELKWQ
jgi:hypothetical protein